MNYNVGFKRFDLLICVCGISVIFYKYVLCICFILNFIFFLKVVCINNILDVIDIVLG